MSNKLKTMVTVLGLSLSLLGTAGARNLSEIKKTGSLIIGINANSEPFQFKPTATAQPTGYEIEIAKMISKSLGVDPVFIEQPSFSELEKMLMNDKVDITINTHPSTSTRARDFSLSIPYACLSGAVLTLDPTAKVPADFVNKQVAVVKDTVFQEYAQKLKLNKPIVEYNTMKDAITAFVTRKTEVAFYWKAQKDYYSRVMHLDIQETPTLWSIPVAVMTQKGNNSLVVAMNSAILKMRKDPAYDALNTRYFKGDNVSCRK